MSYHYFTESLKQSPNQLQNKAFGPIDENQYRVCNLFNAISSPKAFAVASGNILVQEVSGNPNLVNYVIKPLEQPNLDLPKIDFIIYKSILRESIVDFNGIIAPATNNDLTRKIWESHALQLTAFANTQNIILPATPLANDILGFSYRSNGIGENLVLDTDSLNKVFFSNSKTLFHVEGGDEIGLFAEQGFGIMIIFEKIGFVPTFKLAREIDSKISFPILQPSATINEVFKRKHEKETCLSFIDSCAFFSAFISDGIKSFNATEFQIQKNQDLYNNITSKHYNKNKIYLDIRNELDDSYNYYENYNNNISLSLDGTDNLIPINYYRSFWPILIIDNTEILSANTGKIIKLALPNNDNESPLIYLKRAFRSDIGFEKLPVDREKFLTPIGVGNVNLTRLVRLSQNLTTQSINNEIIANYYLIKYIKRVRVDDDQDTGPSSGVDINNPSTGYSLFKRTYLDNLFPIFDMEIPFTNTNFTNLKVYYDVTHIDKILVKDIPQSEIVGNYNLTDYTSSIGIASDVDAITFISFPFKYNTNVNRNNSIIPLGGMEISGGNPFLIELNNLISSIDLQRASFEYNNNIINYVKVVNNPENSDANFKPTNYDFNDVLIISITLEQFENLKTLKNQNFPDGYKVYLGIKDITSIVVDANNYVSFQLVLRGLKHNNNQIESFSLDTDITLYTNEQILGISSGHIFPIAKAYIEEDFGERTNGQHKGIDMETTTDAGTAGQPIYAVRTGVVKKVVKLSNLKHHGGNDDNLGGIRVRILGDNGYHYNYFHMQPNSNDTINEEDTITKGTQIGTIGISGFGYGVNPNWTQYHLHFEVWQSDSPVIKVSPYRVFPELALLPFDNNRGQ